MIEEAIKVGEGRRGDQRTGRRRARASSTIVVIITHEISCVELLVCRDDLRRRSCSDKGRLGRHWWRHEEMNAWELAIAGDTGAAGAGDRAEIEGLGGFAGEHRVALATWSRGQQCSVFFSYIV